ncbi:MAG: glycosyltransferase, partial [Micromonosporaceae bacterium]
MPLLAAAAIAAAAIWLYLLAGHGGYWRTDQRLPAEPAEPAEPEVTGARQARLPPVVAVIPARDEAAMLPLSLPTLLAQDYPGSFRMVIVDDCSSDGTAEVAASVAASVAARNVQVLRGQPRPSGWAGKVWAMEQGVRCAGDDEYLLLTDADIAYEPGALTALVQAAEGTAAGGSGERHDLVSQMALLRARTS